MDRRRFLAATAAGVSGFAGCLARTSGDAEPTTGTPVEPLTLAEQGFPNTICTEEIKEQTIRAVIEPRFDTNWDGLTVERKYLRRNQQTLTDHQTFVDLRDGNRARAYPLTSLWWHEIVNDDFGGPVMVTYCPLCGSVVAGEPTRFFVSGLLWQAPGVYAAASELDNRTFVAYENSSAVSEQVRNNANLVMYDEATRSYWSQILGRAICGPLEGERLTIRPSEVTTWGDWKARYPDTDVLLPPPYSTLVE
ncbi:DUF3179 domain-containing (seleno)protein [Haladaptatus sp. DYSN1]|uniref:DUF3179 domain-containing (seleno)protein n=1 Tax=unclassified Haladaptatus TaxID=2622732 RepID=UPI002405299C|nr:DUF3179 domain-containing (seleno)protein [Haladaptatus sp. DYSN1]